MNSQQLAKTLKKELTRNPKKTAALAIGLGVALWFWAPQAWRWTGGGSDKPKSKAAVAVAEAKKTPAKSTASPSQTTSASATEGQATPELPLPSWSKLLDEIAADPHMQIARAEENPRDPFVETALEKKVAQPEQKLASAAVKPAVVADPTPSSLGIVLEATLISARDSRATLSGKVYRVGGVISVPAPVDSQTTTDAAAASRKGAQVKKELEFVLERIEARRVVLVGNQKNYELRIVRDELADGLDRSASPKQKGR